MRTRRSFDHDAALSRRLAQLGDELSRHPGPGPAPDAGGLPGVRPARPRPPDSDPTQASWWDDHTRPAAARPTSPPPRPGQLPAGPPGPAARWAGSPSSGGRHLAPRRVPAGLGAAQLATVALLV